MKRLLSILLSVLLLLALFPAMAVGAEANDISEFELPVPQAPNYFVFTDGNEKEGQHDDLRMLMS